jgi:hypothetical protein
MRQPATICGCHRACQGANPAEVVESLVTQVMPGLLTSDHTQHVIQLNETVTFENPLS